MADTKPKADELLELANDTIESYGERDTLFDELEPLYFLDQSEADKEAKREGIESVHLPYGTNAIDLVQDLLADNELGIVVPAAAQGTNARKLSDAAEKYLLAVLHQSEKVQKQNILARAAWIVGVRGCIAGRVMGIEKWLEKGDEGTWKAGQRVPLLLQLRDPRYVYPSFGLDGLAYVVEKRKRTVKDLRNSLGDDVLPKAKLTDEVEWVEYWDDKWFMYWADDEPVAISAGKGPWPHRYGGLPYSFEFARQTGKTEPHKRVRPLLKSVEKVIERLALTDSAEATFIMQYNGDALNVFSDGDPDVDLRSGAINYLEATDRVEWLRAGRQPLELKEANAKYAAHLQKGTFPDSMYGMDPGRVMAGYALNMLNQSGQMRVKPIIACIENFMGELLEHCLMISEHYLTDLLGGPIPFHLVQDAEGEDGQGYRARSEEKLDAKKLAGWYQVEVSLGDVMPADGQANVMLALRAREPGPDGRPLLSWETVVDKYGLATSPADEQERIDREAAWNDPQVVALRQALYAAQIKAELVDELAELDIDAEALLAQMQGPPPPEGMPGAMPGAVPGLPPEVMPAAMQGQLMPQPMGAMDEGPMGPPGPPIREKPYF